ncbi:hypothetical protein [Sphingomonas sp. IW22]|uniref:hypothetical protein n=1 Tax=Sphingomonas sp. IW22 TaxID=3242489 RepID=UPI0035222D7B
MAVFQKFSGRPIVVQKERKFASVHANVYNHVSLERHLVDRRIYKERSSAAFAERGMLASSLLALKDGPASCRDGFALDWQHPSQPYFLARPEFGRTFRMSCLAEF